ncbi:DUF3857 domain-containing protein [Gramella jeungdoensis]|uniref:DUF3857 domain-containing protein n=1 Tax=Gramella jeungdoensis TaxID=708091 RepID=A0ABT0Z4J0_9FLAO|nr:DUF3857 domain-containing protein [Gramella jeungdoensis]MCM8570637.1 DUF3857 domain-containing protein [Gramella jeungdoensis]
MNKFFFFVAFILATNLIAQDQKFNTLNTIPSETDLKATTYQRDTTANAFYIFEEGFSQISVKRDYDLSTEYKAKIKILNKEGLKYANIEIPLVKTDHSSEKIYDLKAYTYTWENGKKVKHTLNQANVYKEEFETHDLIKFTFPDAKPGAVLVYSYELVSPYLFDFNTWRFQEYIPKEFSRFTAKIPANYEYYVTKRGELELKKADSRVAKQCIDFGGNSSIADCIETVYEMEKIPAFKAEDYLTAERNFMSRIEFELIQITHLDGYVKKFTKTWDDVDHELRTSKGIGRQLRRDGLVDELLPEEIRALPNNLDKAKAIYSYVQKNYTWNGEYNIHKDMNLKELIKDHTGNVLAINTLLHNLYDAEGFKVFPVMASTRRRGFPAKIHPVLSDFNYIFIQLELENEEYLLDATEKNLDFGRLPFRALNQYARKIDFENGSSWIDIIPKDFSQITFRDSLKIRKDGTSNGFSEQILTGYHALTLRNNMEETSEDEIFNKFSKPNAHTRAIETVLKNRDNLNEKLLIRYSLENKTQKINDRIYFNPFNFQFFTENPFKLEERNYPIDFGYKDAYLYSAIVEIPENYEIEELPKDKALRMSDGLGSLIFAARKISESTLNIQCRLSFGEAVYPSAYYEGLKKFFDEIIQVQTQSLIVLRENS